MILIAIFLLGIGFLCGFASCYLMMANLDKKLEGGVRE